MRQQLQQRSASLHDASRSGIADAGWVMLVRYMACHASAPADWGWSARKQVTIQKHAMRVIAAESDVMPFAMNTIALGAGGTAWPWQEDVQVASCNDSTLSFQGRSLDCAASIREARLLPAPADQGANVVAGMDNSLQDPRERCWLHRERGQQAGHPGPQAITNGCRQPNRSN